MSSPFNLTDSLERARQRLGSGEPGLRKKRSDLGKFRLPEAVTDELRRLLSGQEYPVVRKVLKQLQKSSYRLGQKCPSRATVYKFMRQDPGRTYRLSELPPAVSAAVYNQHPAASIPGAQLAFYCFNYGDLSAAQFAAALPWLPLYQAARMRGWRPKSRGLLRAVNAARGIPDG